MYSDMIPHASVPLPKPEVPASHPFKNDVSHQKLMDYLMPRLEQGRTVRDSKLSRLARIDKGVSGWMRMSQEDRDRQIQQDKDGIPQAKMLSLPLNYVQLDDMMTYYAATFSPNRGMFYQMGKPDESEPSSQIVTLMNNHAIYAGYYREVLQTIFCILKYNIGGFQGFWSKDVGPKLAKGANDETVVDSETIWQGNKLESLDVYNTFWDPTVDPSKVYRDGEWCASVKLVSHYWLQNKASQGVYFNCEDELDNDAGVANAAFYRSPPSEARLDVDTSSGGPRDNWVAILSESPSYIVQTGFELIEMYCRVNPYELKLIPNNAANKKRNRLEIWRFTILNGKTVIEATYMNNIHNYLPYFMGMMNDDLMGESQKSPAEIIMPLQDFASFLLNTHVLATRKNIWGLTVYDPSVVDLGTIPPGEVAARVPTKPTGAGRNINEAIYEHKGVLDTKQTMEDLESVMQIINQFFPTQSAPSQIANIDRAVDSQVAAVQQGANRRMQKGARLLDDVMFRPMRFCFYYNIIQFQPDGESVADFYGRPVTINLETLRNTDLPFIIGQGLKAIDRQAAASQMQQIIFALIQNPATAQRVDLMGMIDYWTSMIDVDIDMKQFQLQPQQPQAAPAGAAGDGADPSQAPADGSEVQGITDPAKMTAPIG